MVAAVIFLLVRPTAINFAWLHEPIDRQLTKLLGREVNIDGDIVLVTGTSPKIRVEKLSVDNPEGWEGGGRFAELEKFETQIGLPELFRKQIKIDDIEIRGIALNLEVDADGRGNWERPSSVNPEQAEPAGEPEEAPRAQDVTGEDPDEDAIEFLGLGSIEISDISVTRQEADGETVPILVIDRMSVGSHRH